MASWGDVRRFALELPETGEESSYGGTRAWKVNGKSFVWERPLRGADVAALGVRAPRGPVLGLRTADLEMTELLLRRDPRVYFTTPHFDGYPAVLVRLDAISVQELRDVIVEAWLARAPARAIALRAGGASKKAKR